MLTMMMMGWGLSSAAWALSTGALELTLSGNALSALSATGGPSWLAGTTPVYGLAGAPLAARLEAEALPDGQALLRLSLTNPGAKEVRADVRFPALEGLGLGTGSSSSDPLGYFFPAQGTILDDAVATHQRYYGTLFPLQVMEIHQGGSGLWLMTRDLAGRAKTYTVARGSDGRGRLEVAWPGLAVPAGATVVLEASLGVHDSDWHEALSAYRRWLDTWYQPRAFPKAGFREAFNLRQVHLHQNAVLGDHPGAFDPESGTLDLQGAVDEDAARLGGVDWVHVFDWGMDFVHGRVGDYNPWSYLGPPEALQAEVDALQAAGIGVGLYVEGYLLDTTSRVGLASGDAWALEDASGGPYTQYAPSWHVCPAVTAWQDHFAQRNGRRTERRVGASGLYVDQHGYGYQYPCHRTDHGHAAPTDQIQAELAFVQVLRRTMSPEQVLYTEAGPIDVTSAWQDGAFSEAIGAFRDDARTVPLSTRRFALPLLKTFALLTQDAPLADDREGVRLAFFNGEGTRHMGYFEDDPWFSEAVLAEIAHAWSVLRAHRAAFTGSAPVPLVETRAPTVLANLFPTDDGAERVWTLYNQGTSDVSGEVLWIDTVAGATYEDCWRGGPLSPPTVQGFARISLALAAGEVGCVVEHRPPPAATLAAHWPLDERAGTTATEAVAGLDGEATSGGKGLTLGVASASPRLGTAWWLDGASGLRLGPSSLLSSLQEDFSVAAWVQPDTDTGILRILAVEGWQSGGWLFGLTHTGDRRALFLTTAGVQDYVLPVVVPVGRWSHVAVVLDSGASAHFYVDGALRGTVSHDAGGAAGSSGVGWWIGANGGADGHWSGGLDDLRVYEGALTPAEVRALADVSPPLPGWLQAAEAPWTDARQLTLWWPGFYDPGSGIADHEIALGTAPGATDLLPFVSVGGDVQEGTLSGLSLPEGTVHVTVRATDGVGLSTEVQGTVTVQTTPPPLLAAWPRGAIPWGEGLDPALERTEDFTVSAWIWPSEAGYQTIMGSDVGGWTFALGGDGDDLVLISQGQEALVLSTAVPLRAWSHVAVSLDRDSDARFYQDGALLGVVHGTLPAPASTSGMVIGGVDFPWQGRLGTVRLYDGVLSTEEIADEHQADIEPPPSEEEEEEDTALGPVDSGPGPGADPGAKDGARTCGPALAPSWGGLIASLVWVIGRRKRRDEAVI